MNAKWTAGALSVLLVAPGCQTSRDLDRPPEGLLSSADLRLSDLGVVCVLSAGADGKVTMSLEHLGDQGILVSSAHTPWRRYGAPFQVSGEEGALPYHGILAAYDESNPEFLDLEPGAELATELPLSENYGMPAGSYTVGLASPLLSIVVGGKPLAAQHDCEPATFVYEPSGGDLNQKEQELVFNDSTCSLSEQTDVQVMEVVARSANKVAMGFVQPDNRIYQEWFGAWDVGRADLVTDILEQIEADWLVYTGDCDQGLCSDPAVNAWVQTGPFGIGLHNVHLCDRFFGLDSFSVEAGCEVGVLLHEKAHLASAGGVVNMTVTDQVHSVCGGTCYGAGAARALAVASPSQAVHNAENYEHFIDHAYLVGAVLPPVLWLPL